MAKTIKAGVKPLNPLLSFVNQMMQLYAAAPLKLPTNYRDRVLSCKEILQDDVSGLANTLLDFAINCASVPYTIDSTNENLDAALNTWLLQINADYRGKIPTGISALAKEYFRERWKGSSHILLRTVWGVNKDGLEVPTAMYFVDGEDIKVKQESKEVVLGEEEYFLRLADNKDITLPSDDNEKIFVQRPFESWGSYEPIPYLMRKGIWHNLYNCKKISEKGEFVVTRALEYLLMIKKGTEKLAVDGQVGYSKDELQDINDKFKELVDRKRHEAGLPTYTTQFDTELEQIIPDYKKALDEALYTSTDRKILAGLGFISVLSVESSGSSKESMLNPKPFMSEVKQGIVDFKALMMDVIYTIVERNAKKKKWMNQTIEFVATPVPEFLTAETKTMMRSLYDRGLISKRTAVEVLGEGDLDKEVKRRESEIVLEETMYPPVIQVQDTAGAGDGGLSPSGNPQGPKATPDDKKNKVEKKNYKKM